LISSHQDLKAKTDSLQLYAHQIGLQINLQKTKVMDFTGMTDSIKVHNITLENVSNFVYLRSRITADGDTKSEIKTRIGLAANAFYILSNIWRLKTLNKHIKLRLFNACVILVLIYGYESWKYTVAIDKKTKLLREQMPQENHKRQLERLQIE
jgi:hypothetical protein